MRLWGVRRALVLIASSVAGSLPVLAQEAPPKNLLRLEAYDTDIRPEKDETLIVLLGEAHVTFESRQKKDVEFLDVRAADAVAFLSSETDLRKKEDAPAIRALYARGHVRLAKRTPPAPPFILEADELWLDLVAERAYALGAVARMPGSTKPAPLAAPNPRSSPRSAATFALRAKKLRLEGTSVLTAEDAALSACDFGLPHEALEATKITILEARERDVAAVGSAADPYRVLAKMTRRRATPKEGSDALWHAVQDPRFVEVEGAGVRVRPPFTGEEGLGVSLPFPVAWETDWPFPDVRIGRSSRWGWFETAGLRVPVLKADVVHDENGRHVKDGLDATLEGGGGFYETRGGTGNGGVFYEYTRKGERLLRGEFEGTYIHDRSEFDRNGSIVPTTERSWIHGVHQEELPLGVHLDAEVSRQSDRNYLLEWERSVALTQKEQETYVYLRRSWDDLGARFDARWRLNDFQSQVEDLPRGRIDWISTPVFAQPVLGGLYFTAGVEVAQFRRRFDDFLSVAPLPDQTVLRGDLDGRLDYKLSVLDKVYFRAWGEGRFTDWSERQLPSGATDHDSIERFLGTVGARAGTQLDAPFAISESGLTLRHVLIPEAGYENRILDTRDPSTIVQIDEIDTYRPGSYVFLRVRNRLQLADSPAGRGAKDLLDVVVEARYFPTSLRLIPGQRIWGEIYSDARLYLGAEGTLRSVAEVDPNRHRLIRLDSTFTWLASRSIAKWIGEERVYPDIGVSLGYHELADLSRAVGWGVDVRLTPSWGASFQELYDFRQRMFLEHRLVVRRYFHGFALEATGSWNPILRDVSFSVGVVPFFEGDEPVAMLDFGH